MKIFWSWQSDTDGKTGRHFVRNAIAQAIQRLKESDEIEEPSEREKAGQMHLDHDRQGVPGSPDLAATIFRKIKDSVVFIADVTPVAELEKIVEGKRKTKKIMNPNVAIELGYALGSIGDDSILMIMNTYYGDREELPFDLAHKAGPITYHLDPDANKQQIEAQSNLLSARVAEALKPYLAAPTPKEEKLVERIQRQKEEIAAKNRKNDFLRVGGQGANVAQQEAIKLLDLIQEQAVLIDSDIQLRRVGDKTLCLVYEGFGYSVAWEQRFINSLEESKLVLTVWKGLPPHVGGLRWDQPQQLAHTKYNFDCDMNLNPGWTTGNSNLFEKKDVAEQCLRFFMDFIHDHKMRQSSVG